MADITTDGQKIIIRDIEKEMKKSFLDYSMSVIVSRALPDVRDGLKPVHRRILYTMFEDSLYPNRPHRKAATTVGDVLGRYHPHGDASVYDALVRMAQPFSLRYPLIDGHGNFGSIDGDPPAAYRYTEARMSRIAMHMLTDIDKETIDYMPNFDDQRKEPVVLPSRFPSLLVNGSQGIAVGMATNVPPHNLGEVVDATMYVMDHPDASIDEIMAIIQGPDFPTGGIILGKSGMREAYFKGRGRVMVRAHAEIEEYKNDRYRIIVDEIPYMVNKARLVESIAEHVKNKRIEGISGLRDESSKEGMRVVIEIKRDANPNIVLNQLYRYTQMQETIPVILLALDKGVPKIMTLKEMIEKYLEFQQEVITRRTRYELKKALEREHILKGLKIALDFIDEVIAIIRANKSINEAKEALTTRFSLSDLQAQAIVDMRLGRLTGLEREKIEQELAEIEEKIREYNAILASTEKVNEIIRQEMSEIREKYADARRTRIDQIEGEIDVEDLIEEHTCTITLTNMGYIKRVPLSTYKAQHRGGRGINAMNTRDEDFIAEMFIASTHDTAMLFTSKGRVHKLKCYEIPEASRTARGSNIVNILPIDADEKISAMIRVSDFDAGGYLTMVTRGGIIKRTALSEYKTNRKGGINAIVLDDDDELVRVKLTDGKQSVILCTHNGMAIRFMESDARPLGRVTRGVKGIELEGDDYVIGMSVARPGGKLMSVTENGYGKKTDLNEYKIQNRAGKGLMNYRVTEKTGPVESIKVVDDSDDVMMISSGGTVIRVGAAEIPVYSRSTQGVRVMRLAEEEKFVMMARTEAEEDEEQKEEAPVADGGADEQDGSLSDAGQASDNDNAALLTGEGADLTAAVSADADALHEKAVQLADYAAADPALADEEEALAEDAGEEDED